MAELLVWLEGVLQSAWLVVLRFLRAAWRIAKERAKRRPGEAIALGVAVLRAFGTTVRTGQAGVLFHVGRARRVLEPGFHWLIPVVQRVRKIPARAVTSNLALQRVQTADGLVYEADANLVWRAVDPIRALVEIADARRGVETVLALAIQEVLRAKTREGLAARADLDAELRAAVAPRLSPWGIEVSQAGFTSIAPTARTLRLTQLGALVDERRRALALFREGGLARESAVAFAAGGTVRLERKRARRSERRSRS